jgi:galactokinase
MRNAVGRALTAGRRAFGSDWSPRVISRAPGRLELLGNHVDYNGGQVLAAAIDRDVVCLIAETGASDEIAAVFADRDPERVTVLRPAELHDWRSASGPVRAPDYLRGVIAAGVARGVAVRTGVRLAIAGDVPIGFGLSSSAALCVALTLALHGDEPDQSELVLRAQEAEHRAGTPCGTMDQSASVAGDVILFDGSSLSFTHLTPDLGDFAFAVADSGVARSLGASSYPTRVRESQAAATAISAALGRNISSLADVSADDLERARPTLDATLMKRARHVATEIERVRQGLDALRRSDWLRFGELMNASGRSSAVDYEISHPAVEALVQESRQVDGVAGARMMGGGEGGAALILLRRSAFPGLVERLGQQYYEPRNLGPASDRVLVQTFGPGASRGDYSANGRERPL